MRPTPNQSSYIEDGYNMILTEAPKDLGGRLFLNLARTMPELPWIMISPLLHAAFLSQPTVCSADCAPDNSDL